MKNSNIKDNNNSKCVAEFFVNVARVSEGCNITVQEEEQAF